MYQNPANNNVLAGGSANNGTTTSNGNAQIMNPNQQLRQQQTINYNGMQPQQQAPVNTNKSVCKKPYVKITEQPAGKAFRFRYECEGRSAGSILGANSTPECKTYPTIEIVGYKGRAVVVVSCVTKDPPYRPHPHNLVGKEGCKKGVCTLEMNSETMRTVFSNLGIQCVKKKNIEAALKAREEIRVDPFKTGFEHRHQPSRIDLNSVRLCFQVFMESDQKGRFTQPLAPVVSEPIFDKKAMYELVISRLSSRSASVLGKTRIILLCEKVANKDISVRFYEEDNGQTIWEAYGDFKHTDVHKQTAITFKTPRYRKVDITEPAKVFIQLKRPSDGVTSEPFPFKYVPLNRIRFLDLRSKLENKPDSEIFQEIHSSDIENYIPNDKVEVNDLNNPSDSAHLRRKRRKTNGNRADLLVQQQQKQHQNYHQDFRLFSYAPNVPTIKTESRGTSPQPFGIYRAPPELTPSPQILSPTNACTHNTASPYNITPTVAGIQQLMSPNHQYNVNSVGPSGINNANLNSPQQVDYTALRQQPQQQQQKQYHGNNFDIAGATLWETNFNPAAAATNNNLDNLTNANAFTMHNLLTPASANVGQANGTDGVRNIWNLISNHFHPQHDHLQQQQQHRKYQQQTTANEAMTTTNNTAVGVTNIINGNNENNNNNDNVNNNNNEHGLSNLLNLDSGQLVRMNTEDQQMLELNPEDLKISNLSIST